MMRNLLTIIGLLLSVAPWAAADELQRLFTTPEQRTQLDIFRSNPPPPEIPKSPEPDPPKQITFNGIILRHAKPVVTWVNGSKNLFQQGFYIALEDIKNVAVPIVLPKTQQVVQLKPGQTIITDSEKEKGK